MRGGRYIKDIVYGANDGIITTFAVVAGVAGAGLDSLTIILLGAANLVADGFSMAASNYLGSKSERDYMENAIREAEAELQEDFGVERRELHILLREHGYEEKDARTLGGLIFKNKEFFTDLMMQEEFNIAVHDRHQVGKGPLITFGAFVVAGLIPILPFFVLTPQAHLFAISVATTAGTLFVVGSLRSLVTRRNWVFSGLEMLLVGGIAALIAYAIGAIFQSLF